MHTIQKDLLSLSRNINLKAKSLREIGSLIGVEHPQQVSHHLKQLEKKGFLVFDRSTKKLINANRKKDNERQFVNIPILGAANCGPAQLLADDNIEGYLKVSNSLTGNRKLMAIKADGDSMNRANIQGQSIESGDYVLVDYKETQAKHGDYVLAVIDGAANIKRFYDDRANDQVILMSESSSNHLPIYIHADDYSDILINGKVTRVIKQPKF